MLLSSKCTALLEPSGMIISKVLLQNSLNAVDEYDCTAFHQQLLMDMLTLRKFDSELVPT